MSERLRRLSPVHWPIAAKIVVSLILTASVPIGLMILGMGPALRDLTLDNLKAYMRENSARQYDAVTTALAEAETELVSIVDDETLARQLTNRLLAGTALARRSGTAVSEDTARTLLESAILDRFNPVFSRARLLDRDGGAVAEAVLVDDPAGASAARADLTAYRALRALAGRGQSARSTLTVSGTERAPRVEIGVVLSWRDGSPLGYLIAELNVPDVLFPLLRFDEALYPAYSYLATGQNHWITPYDADIIAASLASSPAIDRGARGEVGVDLYVRADGTEMVSAYAPIGRSPLVLVTEAPVTSAVSPTRQYFAARLLPVLAVALALTGVLTLALRALIATPLTRLRQSTDAAAFGRLDSALPDHDRDDEIGALARSAAHARAAVRQRLRQLDEQIAEQTRDIAATQEITRYAVSQRDLQSLLSSVADLIVQRFPAIYSAHLFLLDMDRREAVMRAAAGEARQALLSAGYRVAAGDITPVGEAAGGERVVVVGDRTTGGHFRPSALLPATRAQLAIPLRVGTDTIGVLDVHSKQPDIFGAALVDVMQTMADQIAIAIQNARLYEESLRRLREIERSNRRTTLAAWRAYAGARQGEPLVSEAGRSGAEFAQARAAALESGQATFGPPAASGTVPLAVPILLRGAVLGLIEWELPSLNANEDQRLLAQELADRLAITLDNARLFEESEQATDRERVVNTITARLTARTDIDDILRTAVREVGQALRASSTVVRLRSAPGGADGASAALDGNGKDTRE